MVTVLSISTFAKDFICFLKENSKDSRSISKQLPWRADFRAVSQIFADFNQGPICLIFRLTTMLLLLFSSGITLRYISQTIDCCGNKNACTHTHTHTNYVAYSSFL